MRDPQLARIVRHCQDMPGQELFAYEDADGKVHDVRSQDVNEYLRAISGDDFTAKDFRTWAGTVLTAIALRAFPAVAGAGQAKENVVSAIAAVAKVLGNTPAVCRRCYIHPEIVNSYLAGGTIAAGGRRGVRSQLKPEEAAVLTLLRRRPGNKGNGSAKRGTIRKRQQRRCN
jgi:DNA topoisomerase-1